MSNTGPTPIVHSPILIDCVVRLTGQDGNAFAILGLVRREIKNHLRAGSRTQEVQNTMVKMFMTDATSADYEHLLAVCAAWVTLE